MTTNKTRDNIDAELSRTYFGGISSGTKAPQHAEPPKKSSTVKIVLLTALILLLIISVGVYFLMRNQVHFTVNVNVGEGSSPAQAVQTDETTTILYSFEKDDESWEIPSWANDKTDYVATELIWSGERASSGESSIAFKTDHPLRKWSGALVEVQQYLDLTGHDKLLVDVYLPQEAITGLKGKMILTVGDDWKFIEMSRSKKLIPGEWNTIEASIADGSRDWKRTVTNDNFRSDIRKMSVRVESDKNPAWAGTIHLDNVRATKIEKPPVDQTEE